MEKREQTLTVHALILSHLSQSTISRWIKQTLHIQSHYSVYELFVVGEKCRGDENIEIVYENIHTNFFCDFVVIKLHCVVRRWILSFSFYEINFYFM